MSISTVTGNIAAINKDVLVHEMHFGQITTKGGIIIGSDDGKGHGVKPRWGKVYAVGPNQKDVKVGEWILVEHGRWTRKFSVANNQQQVDLQKVDPECILAIHEGDGDPDQNYIGQEYNDGESFTVNPEDFM